MQTFHANTVGFHIVQSLRRADLRGEIAAVFPTSLYVRTFGKDLIFVTNRNLKSPITINVTTSQDWTHTVNHLEPVSIGDNKIRLGESAIIELNEASQWHPNPVASSSSPQIIIPDEALLLASSILMIVDNKLSVLDPSGIAHQGVSKFFHAGVISLARSAEFDQFRELAMKIIGLGGGFTPSGDDVLGGFLATYNSLASKVDRTPILFDFSSLEERTSWISAKLLDYMQRLVLDEQVTHLISSALSGDTERFVISAESILPRGHTSGIDLLVGAVLAVSLVQDIESKSTFIEKVASRLGL